MEKMNVGAVEALLGGLSPPEACPACADCAEQCVLYGLVCELLYKNQVLRFDLRETREQLLMMSRNERRAEEFQTHAPPMSLKVPETIC
jgi:hypothetical protein